MFLQIYLSSIQHNHESKKYSSVALLVFLSLGKMAGALMALILVLPAVKDNCILWGCPDVLRVAVSLVEITAAIGIFFPRTLRLATLIRMLLINLHYLTIASGL